MSSAAEFRTVVLDRERVLSLLEDLIPVLAHYWGAEILGQHGGVSNVPWEQHWKPQEFAIVKLIDHLVGEEAKPGFKVAEYDYFLSDVNQRDMVHLCHEADIHFELSDPELRNRVVDSLVAQGIFLDEGRPNKRKQLAARSELLSSRRGANVHPDSAASGCRS